VSLRFSRACFFLFRSFRQRLTDLEPRPIASEPNKPPRDRLGAAPKSSSSSWRRALVRTGGEAQDDRPLPRPHYLDGAEGKRGAASGTARADGRWSRGWSAPPGAHVVERADLWPTAGHDPL